MKDRLYIAGQILAGMTTNEDDLTKPHLSSYALAAADALIAAHENTELPDDAPTMEWEVKGQRFNGEWWASCLPHNVSVSGQTREYAKAQAIALSKGRGYKAVFIDDSPVVRWRVVIDREHPLRFYRAIATSDEAEELHGPCRHLKEEATSDLTAMRAAASAYSAAKGCRAVFVEEGCKDA